MDTLTQHLSKIKVPGVRDKVYKDECMFSFDNPESETGLYISLASFYGFGKQYVESHFKKTGNAVYLHHFKEKIEVSSPSQGDGPEKKITRLAIGVEGGFDPESGRKKYEFIDHYSIIILPEFTSIPWPNAEVPEIVRVAITALLHLPSATTTAELASLTGTWDGEARAVSVHAATLTQLDNGVKIPPAGWQCARCDKTENLWLNLTDGSVLCGRRFYDGSGGNNHAVEHYGVTGYPLAVKLGTITRDGKGDVFSYGEDELVEDPGLVEHLAHWGINITNLEKTEKSMVELELELNQKTNEWAALQESQGKLAPIFGPGYTGMTNLGNSCYLNSVMQMLFVIPEFIERYVGNAEKIFDGIRGDPNDDFTCQMAKLGAGLHSGRYSHPATPAPGTPIDADPPGISPHSFKTLCGRGHAEFSTKRQQDAQEFFLHVLELVEKAVGGGGGGAGSVGINLGRRNIGEVFKYVIEDRVQCGASGKVRYIERGESLLTLRIPMEAVLNKDEVSAYETRKKVAEAAGKKLEPDSLVRPKLKLNSLLESFTQTEINRYHSSAINDYTTAKQTTGFKTFPKYLLIHLSKYTVREDWVPIKLDVSIDMPDELDLSCYKATGLQEGEELLPVSDSPPQPELNQGIIDSLIEMGFPLESCKKAVFFTKNKGLEEATQWVMEHVTDPDFTSPFVPPGAESVKAPSSKQTRAKADADLVAVIVGMGFPQVLAVRALSATANDIQAAMDWMETHQEGEEEEQEMDDGQSESEMDVVEAPCGSATDGRYKLTAFVSHMGTSISVGHYVVHILKEGRWVIFNDSKVAQSENPPKELGYLYLYERL